jgi:hypothetical protein
LPVGELGIRSRTEAPIRDAFEHASIGFAVIALGRTVRE